MCYQGNREMDESVGEELDQSKRSEIQRRKSRSYTVLRLEGGRMHACKSGTCGATVLAASENNGGRKQLSPRISTSRSFASLVQSIIPTAEEVAAEHSRLTKLRSLLAALKVTRRNNIEYLPDKDDGYKEPLLCRKDEEREQKEASNCAHDSRKRNEVLVYNKSAYNPEVHSPLLTSLSCNYEGHHLYPHLTGNLVGNKNDDLFLPNLHQEPLSQCHRCVQTDGSHMSDGTKSPLHKLPSCLFKDQIQQSNINTITNLDLKQNKNKHSFNKKDENEVFTSHKKNHKKHTCHYSTNSSNRNVNHDIPAHSARDERQPLQCAEDLQHESLGAKHAREQHDSKSTHQHLVQEVQAIPSEDPDLLYSLGNRVEQTMESHPVSPSIPAGCNNESQLHYSHTRRSPDNEVSKNVLTPINSVTNNSVNETYKSFSANKRLHLLKYLRNRNNTVMHSASSADKKVEVCPVMQKFAKLEDEHHVTFSDSKQSCEREYEGNMNPIVVKTSTLSAILCQHSQTKQATEILKKMPIDRKKENQRTHLCSCKKKKGTQEMSSKKSIHALKRAKGQKCENKSTLHGLVTSDKGNKACMLPSQECPEEPTSRLAEHENKHQGMSLEPIHLERDLNQPEYVKPLSPCSSELSIHQQPKDKDMVLDEDVVLSSDSCGSKIGSPLESLYVTSKTLMSSKSGFSLKELRMDFKDKEEDSKGEDSELSSQCSQDDERISECSTEATQNDKRIRECSIEATTEVTFESAIKLVTFAAIAAALSSNKRISIVEKRSVNEPISQESPILSASKEANHVDVASRNTMSIISSSDSFGTDGEFAEKQKESSTDSSDLGHIKRVTDEEYEALTSPAEDHFSSPVAPHQFDSDLFDQSSQTTSESLVSELRILQGKLSDLSDSHFQVEVLLNALNELEDKVAGICQHGLQETQQALRRMSELEDSRGKSLSAQEQKPPKSAQSLFEIYRLLLQTSLHDSQLFRSRSPKEIRKLKKMISTFTNEKKNKHLMGKMKNLELKLLQCSDELVHLRRLNRVLERGVHQTPVPLLSSDDNLDVSESAEEFSLEADISIPISNEVNQSALEAELSAYVESCLSSVTFSLDWQGMLRSVHNFLKENVNMYCNYYSTETLDDFE